jgi:hypothetical protein
MAEASRLELGNGSAMQAGSTSRAPMTLSVSRSWAGAWRACGEALSKATGLLGNSTLATNQSRAFFSVNDHLKVTHF